MPVAGGCGSVGFWQWHTGTACGAASWRWKRGSSFNRAGQWNATKPKIRLQRLSTIRRGPPPLGFYENASERTPIRSVRLATDVPEAERTALQVMRTDTRSFRDATEARRNRVDDFYKRPAGNIDLCNVPIPTRTPPAGKAP